MYTYALFFLLTNFRQKNKKRIISTKNREKKHICHSIQVDTIKMELNIWEKEQESRRQENVRQKNSAPDFQQRITEF